MRSDDIFFEIEKLKDDASAIKMAAYMRDQFLFLGVPTPKRKSACKEFYKQAKRSNEVDWEVIDGCWANEYREMQYIAVDYLYIVQKLLTPLDIGRIKNLAQTKPWWDTIDGLDRVVGDLALCYPEVNDTLLEWSLDEDFWIRRIAIDHQLSRKGETNVDMLKEIIINNLGQTEFFINKAIGWSLRDYSKINPAWVRAFIEEHKGQMAALSIKEASKYL